MSYMRALKHISYKEAASRLQTQLLPEENRMEEKQAVYTALAEAEQFYFSNPSVLKFSYFEKRKLQKETVDKFKLGYAASGKRLYHFLLKKGITEDVMEKAGLIHTSEDGEKSEKFWKRIMFPIHDEEGRTIGFGGRVLGDEKPKYLNSSENIIFDKSHNLYALDIAKHSPENFFLLCEGYLDVISLHQNGFSNAVASLGTAFTQGHAELLKKYKDTVYIVYDSDEPGQKATEKAISILMGEGINVNVVSVAPYKDVDELLVKAGSDEFKKRIDAAAPGKKFLVKNKTPQEIIQILMTEI